jgi:hypothetical protein
VDESETGSANFFGPAQGLLLPRHRHRLRPAVGYRRDVHLRPPSIDRGITSFLWALGLAVFVWFGLRAVGVSNGTAFLLGLISFGAIFLFVRTQGEDV